MINLKAIGKQIEKQDLLAKIPVRENDILFISGSLIEGIGNENSDLDIFILTDSEFQVVSKDSYTSEFQINSFYVINDIQCDVEIWKLSILEELITQINEIDFNNLDQRTFNQINVNEIPFMTLMSLLHRVLVGIPLNNAEKLKSYIDKLNWENYYILLQRMYVNLIDNSFDDIIGNFKSGEYPTALLLARQNLIKAVIVLLLSKNVSIDREKWALIKFEELVTADNELSIIYKKTINLLFEKALLNEESIKENIEDIISLINKIIRISGN